MVNCPKCRRWITSGASDCAACGALLVATDDGVNRTAVVRGLRWVSKLYVVVLLTATLIDFVIASTTSYGARTGMGCNFVDALLVGIECREFPGSRFIEAVLGFPLLVFYVTAMVPSWPILLVPAALLWSPVLYLAHGAWRRISAA